MGVWTFVQDQVLGMKWLNRLIGMGLSALGLDVEGRVGGSVQFFLYDVVKITILLCVLIFVISYIQSYFPPERSKKILGRFHGVGANVIAALLGTVTPFCSCSSIPLFMGFTSAGLPLGVTFSFLISSPMVDLGSLVLLMSIFGARVAVIYVILGLVIAVIGGTVIEKLRMEGYVESFVRWAGGVDIDAPNLTKRERLTYARDQMVGTFRKVFPYILMGVGIGAVIHNWIPERWIEVVLGSEYGLQEESLLSLLSALDGEGMLEHLDSISLEDPAVIRMGYLDRFTVKLPYGADYAEKMRILRLAIESDKVQDNMTGTFDMTREDGRVYLDQSVR